MGSIFAEKKPLENGDCSLPMSPPRYKRRKVSAIRDFPDGCGRQAGIYLEMKEGERTGQKEGGLLENVVCDEKYGRDPPEVAKNISSEEKVESQSPANPKFHNGVELEKSTLLNHDKVERGNEDFLELTVDNPKSGEALLTMDEVSEPKDRIEDVSEDLLGDGIKSSNARKKSGVVDLKEPAHDTVDEGTSVQPCLLPHHSIPPNIVWKEQKYSSRRRISAVRDFPVGCGRNVPRLGDTEGRDIDRGEPDITIEKAAVVKDANLTGGEHEGTTVYKDKVQGLVSGEVGDTVEHCSESDKAGQEEIIEDKNGERHVKEIERLEYISKDERDAGSLPDGLDKELVVYVKDKSKKKKSIVAPCSNVGLREESIAGVKCGKPMVIVQGLMSALHCPWRQGKGVLVKTTPTVASVKKKKVMKCNSSDKDTRRCSPNKSKKDTNNLAEKDVIIPYLEEIDEVSRPLDIKDGDESSENDELSDYQLLPRGRVFDISLPPFGASSSSERGIRSKVRETLRLFQAVHRKLLQEEETKSKDQENVGKRPDLRAAKILKDRGKYMNTEKVIGPVPGVEIGDIFNYRIELAIIGLHGPLQAGIDTTKLGKQAVAISIVASGGYANDVDSSDVLIYTGQGGNATGGDKQPEDQKLERGNLALKNCIDKKTLVRVIRGFKETKPSETPDGRSKTIATYTYDGLYTVEKYWHDLGSHGKLVYKFELRRVPGQPELAWKEVKQSRKCKAREGRCIADVSEGKENFQICAVNTIDDEKPPPFNYITSVMYPDWCQPIPPKGCDCKNGCSDSERCACAVKNGRDIPYNYSGAIVQAKPLVYECGPLCKCPPSCHNRVSQHGIKLPLEVFKTDTRGWGVRCLSAIPSGSFICEYIGELLDDKEAEQRTGNDEYLFDIGQNYNDSTLWDGLSALLPEMTSTTDDVIENIGFTIDAVRYGNIGRFINHSCTPNLYAQNVLYDHEDKRIPHIMLFAAENIPPLQELTYHYNYTMDQVFDSVGNIKKKDCFCGSTECTGRMY